MFLDIPFYRTGDYTCNLLVTSVIAIYRQLPHGERGARLLLFIDKQTLVVWSIWIPPRVGNEPSIVS
jgi:hypothetical protein